MDVIINQGSGILSKILEIKSIHSDMFHSLSGLTGALAIMSSFVEKRVLEGNVMEDVMVEQIKGTLSSIDKRLTEFKLMYEKNLCFIPYAKMWVLFGPLVGMGSSRILTQLRRLEGDLKGDIQLLDLYMQSNQALSLFEISGEKFAKMFPTDELKLFWASNFDRETRVSSSKFVDALCRHLPMPPDVCAYVSSKISVMGEVDVETVIKSVGKSSIAMWVASMDGATSAFLNAHASEITCLEMHRGHLVSGSMDGLAKVFHVQLDGTPLLKTVLVGHARGINDVSCEAGMVATASDDGTAKVWNMMNGEVFFSFQHTSPVKAVFFAGGNKLVTATTQSCQNVTVFDLDRAGIVCGKLYGHVGGTTEICVFRDDVVTTGHDRSIKTWNVHTGRLGQEISRAQNGAIGRMATENFIVTNHGETIKIWDRDMLDSISSNFVKVLHTIDLGERGYTTVHDIHIAGDVLYILISNTYDSIFENTRILLVDPLSGKICNELTIRELVEEGEHCAVICGSGDSIYVGTSKGRFLWFVDLIFKGSSSMGVSTCVEKTSGFANDLISNPLVSRTSSALHEHILVGKQGFSDMVQIATSNVSCMNTCTRTPLRFDSTVFCACDCKGTFLVGCSNAIYRVSPYSGCVPKTIAVFEGVAGSLFEYKDSVYAKIVTTDPKRLKHRKNRIVKICKEGSMTVIARDVHAPESNICAFGRYLIYPGSNEDEICMYDMDEESCRSSIRYTGGATVTHIRSTESEIWTVHGRMDITVWCKDPSDSVFKFRQQIQLTTQISDLIVDKDANDETGFVVAMLDGTVNYVVSDGKTLQSHVYANHRSGPVALARGISIGTEMRLCSMAKTWPGKGITEDIGEAKKCSEFTRMISSLFRQQ